MAVLFSAKWFKPSKTSGGNLSNMLKTDFLRRDASALRYLVKVSMFAKVTFLRDVFFCGMVQPKSVGAALQYFVASLQGYKYASFG